MKSSCVRAKRRRRCIFYDKRGNLIIPAFVARLDRSKAPRGVVESWSFNEEANSVSPYFENNKAKTEIKRPFFGTLREHEAEQYGYKLPNRRDVDRSRRIDLNKHGRPLLFTPSITTRLAASNACKQYLSLTSKNVLDKYAHLFGLKVRDEKADGKDRRLHREDCSRPV